ncbi:M23 family metallopeptidase [Lederbergia galactosidilytica]|uniref:M23 family metallopeptidase n=1 Tax=Lederbergia galactosidilytica TaxID=217031 RepID=UPI0007172BF6|nr:M23 family metallopeptidase [Lederbergia galactosidilytica]MBP1913146.1 murein DD-endopeptidase MepM/ murein hydrolase activator NlpD [Lederbergia galactosidilytica]
MKKIFPWIIIFFCFLGIEEVKAKELNQEEIYQQRMNLYKKTEALTSIPWYYLAAVDQFERSIRDVRDDLPDPPAIIGYYLPPEQWAGPLNPNPQDTNPITIELFSGVGKDGNGDGKIEQTNEEDLLYTLAHFLRSYGVDDQSFRLALWDYYKRDQTVRSIMTNAKIYRTFGKVDLREKAFPLPKGYNYTYKNTWGDRRGWGGRRIHEGTDIFAGYGTPVRAIAYGVVELKGWNKYGGWRVGIRDVNNTYHYYAHLNGFSKDLKIGDVVKPGDVIGSVGSSGYGPPGTSGKFPPHLHFGMYKDNGIREWSFDPFPHLKIWERY